MLPVHDIIVGQYASTVLRPSWFKRSTVTLVSGNVDQMGFDHSRFTPSSHDALRADVVRGLTAVLARRSKLPEKGWSGHIILDAAELMLGMLVEWGTRESPTYRAWRASGGSFTSYVDAAEAFLFDVASHLQEQEACESAIVGYFNVLGNGYHVMRGADNPFVTRGRRWQDLRSRVSKLLSVFPDHPGGYFLASFTLAQFREWVQLLQANGIDRRRSMIVLRLFETDGGALLPARVLRERIEHAQSAGFDVGIWEYVPAAATATNISTRLAAIAAA